MHRVYTQQQFDEFPQFDAAECTVAHPARLILQQLRFGLSELGAGTLLQYLDDVPRVGVQHASGLLRMVGAFDGSAEGVTLGPLGLALSALNIEPMSGIIVLSVCACVPVPLPVAVIAASCPVPGLLLTKPRTPVCRGSSTVWVGWPSSLQRWPTWPRTTCWRHTRLWVSWSMIVSVNAAKRWRRRTAM